MVELAIDKTRIAALGTGMARRLECWYGGPGTQKTESIIALIKAIFTTPGPYQGKPWRVLVGDGSAANYQDHGLIEAGLVQLCEFTSRAWPLSTLKQLCEGWWPEDVEDPRSKLIAPKPEVLKGIGGYAIEGLSVGSQYLMGDAKGGLSDRAAHGEKIGQDSPIMVLDLERDPVTGMPVKNSGPGNVFGGNPMAHFGFAQRRMLTYVEASRALPGWARIWTAHESASKDAEITEMESQGGKQVKKTIQEGEDVVGVEVVGKKLTTSIARYFNNTLHFQKAFKKQLAAAPDAHTAKRIADVDVEWRIYTRDHLNPNGGSVRYIANARCPRPGLLPNYLAEEEMGQSILKFYTILAEAKRLEMMELTGENEVA